MDDIAAMSLDMSVETEEIARVVVDAAYFVHRQLGPGFVESIYESALAVELTHRGMAYQRQLEVPIHYRGILVGDHKLDLLVADRLVVEIKSLQGSHAPQHVAQVISYLRATDRELGLLLNFGLSTMRDGIKRIVQSPRALPD
ncbi:MAG TPA: GxxExxY protein [Kofleriaceae bacterium]|jgi:GxxExxY protein